MLESEPTSSSSSSSSSDSSDDESVNNSGTSRTASELALKVIPRCWPEDIDRTSTLYEHMAREKIRVCALISFIDKVVWCTVDVIRPLFFDPRIPVIYSLQWTELGDYMIVYMLLFVSTDLLTMWRPKTFYPMFLCGIAIDSLIYSVNPELVRLSHRRAAWDGLSLTHWSMGFVVLIPMVLPRFSLAKIYTFSFCCTYFVVHVAELLCLGVQSPWQQFLNAMASTVAILIVAAAATRSKDEMERVEWKASTAEFEEERTAVRFMELLQEMLPSFIVPDVLRGTGSVSYSAPCASILFILIDEFVQLSLSMTPEELLDFLNCVFSRFDAICAMHDVTKIETIGEEFVCAVGVSPEDIAKSQRCGHTSVLEKLLHVSSDVASAGMAKTKMGMHTGPVVAGVVGRKLPRFRLFGDTVNTAARMMQKSLPGVLQFGEETRQHVPSRANVIHRGMVEMKGKGMMMTYTVKLPFEHFSEDSSSSEDDSSSSADDSSDSQIAETSKARVRRQTALKTVASLAKFERWRNKNHNRDMLRNIFCSGHIDFRKWRSDTYTSSEVRKHAIGRSIRISLFTAVELLYILLVKIGKIRSSTVDTVAVRAIWGYALCRCACLLNLWIYLLAGERIGHTVCLSLWDHIGSTNLIVLSYFFLLGHVIAEDRGGTTSRLTLNGVSGDLLSLTFLVAYMYNMLSRRFPFRETCIFLALHATPALLIAELCVHVRPSFRHTWLEIWICVAFVMLCRSIAIEWNLLKQWHAQVSTQRVSQSIKDIVDNLLPPLVVRSLSNGVRSHHYNQAMVVQSDLCGFTKLASDLPPDAVMALICEVFCDFDNLADKFSMHKVETVGDAYIAAQAEQPLTFSKSPLSAVHFGLAMLSATEAWSEARRHTVKCRVGIHYGQCMGGVVGESMMRYHLFGQMMTIVEVLESTAPEGGLQVSHTCRSAVEKEVGKRAMSRSLGMKFSQRLEPVLTTSKGTVHTYDEVTGPTFLVTARKTGPKASESNEMTMAVV